jgi:hypothetical protein
LADATYTYVPFELQRSARLPSNDRTCWFSC